MVQHTVGTVVSPDMLQVTAQVTGMLAKAYFQEGQLVKKGDPLFEIDPRPFQAALAQAQAQLAKDQATAQSELRREALQRFMPPTPPPSSSGDQAAAVGKDAVAWCRSDQAAANTAKINLGYTNIISPIDGKTGPLMIQPGNVITAAGTTPLVTITQVQPIKLSFFLPQSQLAADSEPDGGGQAEGDRAHAGRAGRPGKGQGGFHLQRRSAPTPAPSSCAPPSPMRISAWCRVRMSISASPSGSSPAPSSCRAMPSIWARHRPMSMSWTSNNIVSSKTVTVLNDDGINDAIKGDIKPGDTVVVEGQLAHRSGQQGANPQPRDRRRHPADASSDMPS